VGGFTGGGTAQRLHKKFQSTNKVLRYGAKLAYLLELLNSTLVNTTALVDQVCLSCKFIMVSKVGSEEGLTPSRGRLARVDVADNDDVDMSLFLTCTSFVSITEHDRDGHSGPLSTALRWKHHLPMVSVSSGDLEAETRLF
jgi:hypothetical protein